MSDEEYVLKDGRLLSRNTNGRLIPASNEECVTYFTRTSDTKGMEEACEIIDELLHNAPLYYQRTKWATRARDFLAKWGKP